MRAPSRVAPRSVRRRAHLRGFTLTELMVAITGGLFVSIAVFALARQGSRLYQRESRVASATLAGVVGFQRLKADLQRAGFMSSPNVRRDPFVCGDPVTDAKWPDALKRLSTVRLTVGGSPSNASLTTNSRTPDSIVIAGAFDSAEQFPIRQVRQDSTSSVTVFLQVKSGPMARAGIANLPSIFRVGQGVRIVDLQGRTHFSTVSAVNADASQPTVTLTDKPLVRFRASSASCGLKAFETGALINVVNFVKYEVRNLASNAAYAPIYATAASGPYDGPAQRTELVRTRLDTSDSEVAGSAEIVAEYAVDLKFGLTVASILGGDQTISGLKPGNAEIPKWAGDTVGLTDPVKGPQLIRAIRARLSVRSREPDRDVGITPGTGIAPGLYRFQLAPGKFARVRTMQAEIAMHNSAGSTWQ